MRSILPHCLAAFLLAGQLSCAGVRVPPDHYPTAASGCQLPGVRVGQKLRLTMKDGRKTVGRFVRVDCTREPALLLVGFPAGSDLWGRPDTETVAFSSIERIGVGDSESTKSAYALVIGFMGVIAILLLAHVAGGSWPRPS